MASRPRHLVVLLAGCLALLGAGCSSVYYDLNEQILGRHKRDILTSRVQDARHEQQQAQEQFLSTFELFKQATDFEGGEIESYYNKIQREYDASEDQAGRVRERVRSIEKVAGDLFAEWESEIDLISSADLRRRSQSSLGQTRRRYDDLIRAMGRAESKMEPVLVAFRDQVLFLKHNLNARAIASLEGNALEIEDDVADLIRDMQAAIREAESFVATLEG